MNKRSVHFTMREHELAVDELKPDISQFIRIPTRDDYLAYWKYKDRLKVAFDWYDENDEFMSDKDDLYFHEYLYLQISTLEYWRGYFEACGIPSETLVNWDDENNVRPDDIDWESLHYAN